MAKILQFPHDPINSLCIEITREIGKSFDCRLVSLPEEEGVKLYRVDASASGTVLVIMGFGKMKDGMWTMAVRIISPALVTPMIGHDIITIAHRSSVIGQLDCKVAA